MKPKSTIDELRKEINDYFILSRTQRRGSLFLLWLILILCSGFYFINYLKPDEHIDSSAFQKEVQQLEMAIAMESKKSSYRKEKYDRAVPFHKDTVDKQASNLLTEPIQFDPNVADEPTLKNNGFSDKQIQVILNYRKKGGEFKKKEDLKKIYGLSISLYQKLEPYISIKQEKKSSKSITHDSLPSPLIYETLPVFDLNSITQAELDSIKGIGPVMASSIINYRTRLGGYIILEQLFDVYGMDTVLYEKITGRLTLKPTNLNKININQGFETDLKHPYINKTLSKLIVNYRKLHGPYERVEDLRKLALLNEELYVKLAPYLSVE